MSVSPTVPNIVQPKVTDHTFYLFDDTDEHTRSLCGVGCAFGPEDHISPTDFAAAQRVRDAAPLMLEALQEAIEATPHPYSCQGWSVGVNPRWMGNCTCWMGRARAALAAAQAPERPQL